MYFLQMHHKLIQNDTKLVSPHATYRSNMVFGHIKDHLLVTELPLSAEMEEPN